ncbi:hypothetical protein DPMN_077578 [Dreissena polymorpha]|uniref:Uncharacterized protein n=1 Tax=Dreissena polymorpha TaxID=45954 RepID=A0A9D3YKQ3_DREPO|nr:hypothetical protein DPMN_077578 [Dreissena polymorpha]
MEYLKHFWKTAYASQRQIVLCHSLRTKTAINWTEANKKCTFDGDTWDPLPSHRIKQTLAMLAKGPSVWLSKYPHIYKTRSNLNSSKCIWILNNAAADSETYHQ